LNAKFWLFT